MMFIDMQCPLCGRVCGNSRGDFSVSCSCGWTGGIDPADQAAILGFLERAKAWDDEASTEPACICKCVANWGGHCVVPIGTAVRRVGTTVRRNVKRSAHVETGEAL